MKRDRPAQWLKLKNQRCPDGRLTPLALALTALEDHGCDCDESAPDICLACLCVSAFKHIYDKLSAAHVETFGRLTVREACRRRFPLNGSDAQALEHALTITERERNTLQAVIDSLVC